MQQFLKSYEEFETKSNAFVIKVERDWKVPAKKFEKSKYLNFYVRIYIDVDNLSSSSSQKIYQLDDISFVKYELHRSYLEPIRTSSDRRNNFELKVWAYGFYPIKATIYLKWGTSFTITGNVKFKVSDEEIKRNNDELK